MRKTWMFAPLAAFAIAAAAGPLPAQEAKEPEDPAMTAFKALEKEFSGKRRDAAVKEDREAAMTALAKEYLPKFREFADAHSGTEAGLSATSTVLFLASTSKDDAAYETAFDQALKTYGDSDMFARIVRSIRGAKAEAMLQRVLAASKNGEVKATAQCALGDLSWEHGEAKGEKLAMARAAYDAAVRDFPGSKGAKRAAGNLFEIDHLQVGMQAPDISFPDVAGNEHRLADYRGKVVLLNFWASWWGPCNAEIPTLKTIQERFGAKDFALLGISIDESRDALDKKVAEKALDWTIGWERALDGKGQPVLDVKTGLPKGKAWESASAAKYNVQGIPSIWLIDKDGVIRKRDLRKEALENAIAELVEGGKPAPATGSKAGG